MSVVESRARPRALAIVALVAAVLAPPLGVVLGVASLAGSRARPSRGRGVDVVAVIVGSVLTVLLALSVTMWLGLTVSYSSSSVIE